MARCLPRFVAILYQIGIVYASGFCAAAKIILRGHRPAARTARQRTPRSESRPTDKYLYPPGKPALVRETRTRRKNLHPQGKPALAGQCVLPGTAGRSGLPSSPVLRAHPLCALTPLHAHLFCVLTCVACSPVLRARLFCARQRLRGTERCAGKRRTTRARCPSAAAPRKCTVNFAKKVDK